MLDAMGLQVIEYRSEQQEVVQGLDGEYEIGFTVRFSAFGMDFLLIIKWKHQNNRIKRNVLQFLQNWVASIGAQKGIVFSTAGLQSDAIEYAKAHVLETCRS